MASTSARRPGALLLGLLLTLGAVAGSAGGAAAGVPTDEALGPLPVNDPGVRSGLTWHLDAIGARVAWRSSLGADVVVAVIDSGVDGRNPDLVGQVDASVSCIGADGDPDGCEGSGADRSGHGTHVAGLVAGRADDWTGIAGVAPRARILAVRALTAPCPALSCQPTGNTADLAAGVRWAVAHHADVINLSVATDRRLGPELTDALREAWDAGAIPVLAAGNRGNRPLFFDARSAVFVTATDRRGQLAPYAPSVDVAALGLAAPGGTEGDTRETCHIGGRPVGILSTYALRRGDRSGYACMAGTSMAAPQVSGGLALLLSMGFTRDEALERIVTTARPGAGLGAGRIDLAAAVAGPLPLGVRNRHDALLGSVDAHDTAPSQAPTTGPFSVPRPPGRSGPPLWLAMAGGGLAVGLLAEVTLRVVARRRAEPARSPPGDG